MHLAYNEIIHEIIYRSLSLRTCEFFGVKPPSKSLRITSVCRFGIKRDEIKEYRSGIETVFTEKCFTIYTNSMVKSRYRLEA